MASGILCSEVKESGQSGDLLESFYEQGKVLRASVCVSEVMI
jgi:hypothetical protein